MINFKPPAPIENRNINGKLYAIFPDGEVYNAIWGTIFTLGYALYKFAEYGLSGETLDLVIGIAFVVLFAIEVARYYLTHKDYLTDVEGIRFVPRASVWSLIFASVSTAWAPLMLFHCIAGSVWYIPGTIFVTLAAVLNIYWAFVGRKKYRVEE